MRSLSLFILLNLILFTCTIYADEGGFRIVDEQKINKINSCSLDTFLCLGKFNNTFRTVWSNGEKRVDIDLEVNTQLSGGAYDYKGFARLAFPIEFRIRANLNGVDKIVSLHDIKMGLFKLLIRNTGISLQLMSYVKSNYDFKSGIYHGVEATTLTFSNAIPLFSDKSLELVINAYGAIAFGALIDSETVSKTRSDDMQNLEDLIIVRHSGNGSLGIRIENKLLLEFFGSIDYFHDSWGTKSDVDARITGRAGMIHTTYGGRLKYKINEAINLGAAVQREDYKSFAKIDYPTDSAEDDIINRNNTSTLVSLFRFEYFW